MLRFDKIKEEINEKLLDLLASMSNKTCKKENVTFYRHSVENSTGNVADSTELVTLEVDMFQCPIDDFYLTQGDGPTTVARLYNAPNKDNLCVKEMFRRKST